MTKAAAKSSVIKGVHLTFVLCVIKITRAGVVANEFRLSDNLFLPSSSFDDLAQEVCYEIGQVRIFFLVYSRCILFNVYLFRFSLNYSILVGPVRCRV